jgi:transcriptional regulator with XRE-family HTH domain
MTKLDTYLKPMRAGDLARQIGVSEAYISDLRKGKRSPSLAVAFAIEDATGGVVTARSWLEP